MTAGRILTSRARSVRVMLAATFLLGLLASAIPTPVARAADNPIVTENQQPGSSAWQLTRTADDVGGQIKGYGSLASVPQGGSLTLYVSVNPAQTYTIDVYRVGWYGGLGGRLRLHAGPFNGSPQAACVPDATTGMIDCNWTPSYSLTIPGDWTSGAYVAVLKNAAGYQNYVVFVVRDGRPAAFLYQQGVNTAQAYNNYPNDSRTGKSLYEYNSYGANTVTGTTRAAKVSFDRPYAGNGSGLFLNWDIQAIRWLERSGYDVTYSTDVDTHTNGGELMNHKAFFSVGHNEYWSNEMYNAAQAARDAGVNLAFFGANDVYWQVRFEASAAGVPNRVMVCYKSTIDPVQGATTTLRWRDPPVNRPEQRLIGVMYTSEVNWGNNVPYVVTNSSHWVYTGTGFQDGAAVPGIVGYEMDRYMSNYPAPTATSRTLLSQSPYTSTSGAADYSNSSIYQAPSGAWVFAAGTMSWSWGLDNYKTGVPMDARIQQTTATILNAFLFGAPIVHHLKLTAPPSSIAGQAFSITVTAENAQGTPVTSYGGTVHFSSSDTSAGVSLPADSTLTNGQGSFSATLVQTGPQTLTVADAVNNLSATANLTVNPRPATSLALLSPPGAVAGQPFTVSVRALDDQGNLVPSYGGTVHFSSSDTAAGVALPSDSTLSGGQGTFSATLIRAGPQTLTVADAANSLSTTANLTVSPQSASKLVLATATTTPVAGSSFSFTVTAQDPFGNTATSYAGTVRFSSSDTSSGVMLPPDSTLTSGQGAFSATLVKAGPQTLTVSDAASGLSDSANLTVTASSVVHDLKVTAPSNATAGQPVTVTVTAEDAQGNPVTSYSGTVHFSSSDTSAGVALPPDSTLTGGQGSFSAKLIKAGPQTLTVSDAANALSATATLMVDAQPASKLVVVAGTAAPTAGTSFSFTVTAQDPFGNTDPSYGGIIQFTSSDTSSRVVLPPDSTLSNGRGIFSATLIKVGSQTLTGTDPANGFSSTAAVTVNAASASSLLLVTSTSTATAGTSVSMTVTAQDPYGNTATGYAGTVHFSSSDTSSGVVLPPNSSLSSGQGTFSAKLIKAGPQTLTAADTANGFSSTASLTVNAAPASKLTLASATATPVAGTGFGFTVTAQDAFGNTDPSYAGTVHFSSSDSSSGVQLPPNSTLTGGQGSFSAMLIKAGPQTLTGSDTAGAISGTANLTVNAAPASSLVMSTATTTPTAGASFAFTVTAQDSFGNTATSYAATVHFASSDTSSGVVLPPNSTLTGGQASFSAKLIRAGPQTLTASDAANSLATTANLTVNAAAASKLVMSPATSTPTAGTGFSFMVTAQDPYSNVATSYGGTVHFSSSDTAPGVVLPPNSGLSSGQGTFSATLIRAGAQTLTGSDAANALSVTANLTVNAAPASKLTLATATTTPTAGTSFSFTVTAQDPFGNTATGYAGTVHFSSSDSSAGVVLPANSTLTSGQRTFSATLIKAGTQTVTGADTANSSITGALGVQVKAAAAASLSLTVPATAVVNQPFNATVTLKDRFGNVATGYTGTVHFTSSDLVAQTLGQLPADYTYRSADAGTHVFSVILVTPPSQTITVTDTVNGNLSATSPPIAVSAV